MANSIASPYADALGAERQKLEDIITTGVKTIALPSQKNENSSRDKLLDSSGWIMVVIGVAGVVAGLVTGVSGITIAGCAALLCGGYCYFKSIQLGRMRAFASATDCVRDDMDKINARVSSEWSAFIKNQNITLTREIIASSAGNDAKVAMIDCVATAPFNVDMSATERSLAQVARNENVADFDSAVNDYVTAAKSALEKAATAQQSIYASVDNANK